MIELLNAKSFSLSTLYSLSCCCYSLVMDVCKLPSLTVQSKLQSIVKLMFPDTNLRGWVWVLSLTAAGWKPAPSLPGVWSGASYLPSLPPKFPQLYYNRHCYCNEDVITSGLGLLWEPRQCLHNAWCVEHWINISGIHDNEDAVCLPTTFTGSLWSRE